ncbi:MAG TPA: DUF6265 family protein [Pyrinomonadaceae bacterium]|nr:DUF6265 family protein [Pyrinomonadaceae bacterium]
MHKSWAARTYVAVSLFLVSTVFLNAQETKPTIDGLSWMGGCWQLSVPQRNMTITEHWMKPEGGTMIGMGRTVAGGKTASFEFLRIVASEAGIDYIARPSSNKEETPFRMLKLSAGEVVFENLKHDFPQRIIYRKGEVDSLFARIEGMRNGELRGMDIPMKRIRCEQ